MDNEDVYLIWSNEHRGWWKAGAHGYSPHFNMAGHYTREAALRMCRDAIPTAMHLGMVSEIPVRLVDVKDFLAGQIVPRAITG